MISKESERTDMSMERQINVRVTDSMYEFLEKKAREEDRSAAQVVRRIIAKNMETTT